MAMKGKKESEAVLFTNGEEHDGKKEVIERNVKIVSVRPGSEVVVGGREKSGRCFRSLTTSPVKGHCRNEYRRRRRRQKE